MVVLYMARDWAREVFYLMSFSYLRLMHFALTTFVFFSLRFIFKINIAIRTTHNRALIDLDHMSSVVSIFTTSISFNHF